MLSTPLSHTEMIAADRDWIEKTLLDQDQTKFERLGTKRLIFKVSHHAPLVSLFIDPPPAASVDWMPCVGKPLTDCFFERLSPIVAHRQCTWFFVSLPQDEYTVLQWVAPLNMATWSSSMCLWMTCPTVCSFHWGGTSSGSKVSMSKGAYG